MKTKSIITIISICTISLLAGCLQAKANEEQPKEPAQPIPQEQQEPDHDCAPYSEYKINDVNRPQPQVVNPGAVYGQPPSHAIVLFDGKDTSKWVKAVGEPGPIEWKVENGYMEVVKDTGHIRTIQSFGDCQLHVEWAAPAVVVGEGQFRGNSGVFLMSAYEVQVLDSFKNETYPDGQAGAIYAQYPPMFNAAKAPGEWQAYDIIFRRPKFNEQGEVIRKASMTVFHNGVLVQDHVQLEGVLTFDENKAKKLKYFPHPDKMPIALQDHLNPVRYRNIWIIELPESE